MNVMLIQAAICVLLLCSCSTAQSCTGGKVWTTCGSCDKTCENPSPMCMAVCQEKCECPTDTVWSEVSQSCIALSACPKTTTSSAQICTGGKVWTTCGSCDKTCEDPNPPCFAVCQEKCECPTDTVWSESSQSCIALSACPTTTTSSAQSCTGGKVWTTCGSCDKTCENPSPMCMAVCQEKCECPTDTVWSESSQSCIALSACPKTTTSSVQSCTGGKVWTTCGSCDKTCENPSPMCMAVCQEKCECPTDTVWSESSQSCIALSACPTTTSKATTSPVCTGGKVWKMCGSACTSTCADRTPMCTEQCVQKCECPSGAPYWSEEKQMCIDGTQCPGGVCTGGRVWNSCAGCERTCKSDRQGMMCAGVCQQRCACPRGTPIWDETSQQCKPESFCSVTTARPIPCPMCMPCPEGYVMKYENDCGTCQCYKRNCTGCSYNEMCKSQYVQCITTACNPIQECEPIRQECRQHTDQCDCHARGLGIVSYSTTSEGCLKCNCGIIEPPIRTPSTQKPATSTTPYPCIMYKCRPCEEGYEMRYDEHGCQLGCRCFKKILVAVEKCSPRCNAGYSCQYDQPYGCEDCAAQWTCIANDTNNLPGQCPSGSPKGYCGRADGPCDKGDFCHIHPADAFAICCRKPKALASSCPMVLCGSSCTFGYVTDSKGCQTCTCVQPFSAGEICAMVLGALVAVVAVGVAIAFLCKSSKKKRGSVYFTNMTNQDPALDIQKKEVQKV